MSGLSKPVLALLVAGWLADLLAGKDRDVEAGVAAYEAGELPTALSHFDAAVERLGDRAELSFDRGLVLLAQGEIDAARKAFEHASEAEDFGVRGSAFYELGNLAFDAEDYPGAIAAYIECLKARPDHQNAKWNLEMALLKQTEKEKEEEQDKDEEEDKNEDDNEDESGEDSGGEDSGGGDSGGEDSGGEDSGGGDSGGQQDSGESGGNHDQDQDQGESGGQPPQDPGQDKPPEPAPSDDKPEDKPQDQPAQPQPAAPLNQMDIDKALEDLDDQDVFLMDRPTGRPRKPVQDW